MSNERKTLLWSGVIKKACYANIEDGANEVWEGGMSDTVPAYMISSENNGH